MDWNKRAGIRIRGRVLLFTYSKWVDFGHTWGEGKAWLMRQGATEIVAERICIDVAKFLDKVF